eukprot:767872-Hanusia_phi.AAC.2
MPAAAGCASLSVGPYRTESQRLRVTDHATTVVSNSAESENWHGPITEYYRVMAADPMIRSDQSRP